LDAGAFSNDGVVKASEGLYRILADSGKDGKLFSTYGVNSMPTILFLNPDGKKIGEMDDRSPEGVKKQFEEIAAKNTRAPRWIDGADAGVDAARTATKPAVLFFADEKPKSKIFQMLFSDPTFGEDMYEKAAFAKVEFKKDSDECKKWKVTEAPVVLIVDPSGEGKVLKTVKGGTPRALRKEIEDAIKKLQPK
jgi:hypothetical protein